MSHIGFESIKTKVLDVDKNFSWARIMYFKDSDFNQSFDKFADFVQKCVDDSTPAMISVPASGKSWHILTVVGYGGTHFLVYNPAPHIITSQVPISKAWIQTALGGAKNLQGAATDSDDRLSGTSLFIRVKAGHRYSYFLMTSANCSLVFLTSFS